MLRVMELALRFPATRRVTYQASVGTAKLLTQTYDDFLDDVAWEIAKNRYIREQAEKYE